MSHLVNERSKMISGRRKWLLASSLTVVLLFVLQVLLPTVIATKAADPERFFRSLDKDADGDLDADEIRKVIQDTGVEQFDEQHEVEHGVTSAMGETHGQELLHKDLVAQWMALASLMSPDTVGEWMTHAVGLRSDLAEKFVKANWTGLELPMLLNSNVDHVLSELKVRLSRPEKLKLIGALKLRMLNVGRVPHAPVLKASESNKSARCGTIFLSWSNSERSFPEVHNYRLFRRVSRDDDLPENPWTLIFEGHTTSFTDRIRDTAPQFDYKIEAWNLIGRSVPTELHDVIPSKRGCDSANWLFNLFYFLLDMRMYSVNAIGAFTFVYFYFKAPSSDANRSRSIVDKNMRAGANGATVGLNGANGIVSGNGVLHHGHSFYRAASSGSIMSALDNSIGGGENEEVLSDLSSTRLPELSYNGEFAPSTSKLRTQTSRQYSTDRCVECGRSVTRSTRHQCGMCLHVFCTKHTAIHPHLETKLPLLGTVVLSTCGINSKCRCYSCAGMQYKPASPNGSTSSKQSSDESPRYWKRVKRDILMRKTLRIWRRKEENDSKDLKTSMLSNIDEEEERASS